MLHIKVKRLAVTAAAALIIAGCAIEPKVRSDAAANINFSGYKTFSFMPEPATDNAGYTTLITQHFKDAISSEMTALGYQYNEANAELLVNFNSNVESRTDVRSSHNAGIQYHHYRSGLYAGFPIFNHDIDTIHYKYGTVNIDVIDAAKQKLIWQGISEGTLKKADLDQPKQAISSVVGLIFQQFPTRRGTE
jgi:hypothetical protein